MGRLARGAAVLAFFSACVAAVSWPQARLFATHAVPHQDIYFNLWRLQWFGHAVVRAPMHLFDGNIFYPEPRTLALSDAMLVEGVVAAPMLWAGARPMLVHNLLILGAMVASAAAMFVLVRRLTGSRGAGAIAGLVFALAPYRFEHVMHMELQWAMWSPLALLSLDRAIETGRPRWGLAAGGFAALQMLSCIYYGVYLGTLMAVCGALLLIAGRGSLLRSARALGAGVLLAAVICGVYAVPYLRVRAATGERPIAEVVAFSAKPSSYLVATPDNWLYGGVRQARGGPERRLFPGAVPLLLAVIGLLLRPPERWQIVALLGLVIAFEMSLGLNGYIYSSLYAHVGVFRGLRASARLGMFVLLFLGILAGYGYRALAGTARLPVRAALCAVICGALLAEYRVHLPLMEYPNAAPAPYRFLSTLPRGVVAEIPFADPGRLPGDDPYYAYGSTFHFFPLVNGYSGVYPKSYLARGARMQGFPDETSIEQLRRDGVTYVVVHEFTTHEQVLLDAVARSPHFEQLGSFNEGAPGAASRATVFRFR